MKEFEFDIFFEPPGDERLAQNKKAPSVFQ